MISARHSRPSERAASAEQAALNALRESEAQMRAILSTAVDGIITINDRGVIELFNPAAERIFGYKAEEVLGQNVSLLMPIPHRDEHEHYMARYFRTGEASIIGIGRQVAGRRKDGVVIPLELAVSEVPSGPRRLFTGIVRDISDRKRAEEAIASISEFERQQIGRELHDGIGQEITGLTLLAKALANKLKDHPDLRAEAEHISSLAAKLLQNVKRQAHGLYPVELERNGLSFALRELALNQTALFRTRCEFDQAAGAHALDRVAELHVYRIAQEAVTNAIRHGQAKRVLIRLEERKGYIVLTVKDNGSGIPEKIPEKRGMGLAIMRYRANALGGVLRIGRNSDHGTSVICSFPRPAPKAQDSARKG
jgi:PAS domain S-box-containing protein